MMYYIRRKRIWLYKHRGLTGIYSYNQILIEIIFAAWEAGGYFTEENLDDMESTDLIRTLASNFVTITANYKRP